MSSVKAIYTLAVSLVVLYIATFLSDNAAITPIKLGAQVVQASKFNWLTYITIATCVTLLFLYIFRAFKMNAVLNSIQVGTMIYPIVIILIMLFSDRESNTAFEKWALLGILCVFTSLTLLIVNIALALFARVMES